jgi:hypothetical protein
MVEFIARNGGGWTSPPPEETAAAIERLSARTLSEQEFAAWLDRQLS